MMDSDRLLSENIKKEYLRNKNDSPLFVDPILQLQLLSMKDILKTKSKDELLNCITSENMINKLSYIEKLKNNTVAVMKFREYPETYDKLKQILGE